MIKVFRSLRLLYIRRIWMWFVGLSISSTLRINFSSALWPVQMCKTLLFLQLWSAFCLPWRRRRLFVWSCCFRWHLREIGKKMRRFDTSCCGSNVPSRRSWRSFVRNRKNRTMWLRSMCHFTVFGVLGLCPMGKEWQSKSMFTPNWLLWMIGWSLLVRPT